MAKAAEADKTEIRPITEIDRFFIVLTPVMQCALVGVTDVFQWLALTGAVDEVNILFLLRR